MRQEIRWATVFPDGELDCVFGSQELACHWKAPGSSVVQCIVIVPEEGEQIKRVAVDVETEGDDGRP